jgi:hypothetical protein
MAKRNPPAYVFTSAALKHRALTAIEQALQHGPVHLLNAPGDEAVRIAFLDSYALIYLLEGEPIGTEVLKRQLRALAEEQHQLMTAVSRLSVLECRLGPLCRGN